MFKNLPFFGMRYLFLVVVCFLVALVWSLGATLYFHWFKNHDFISIYVCRIGLYSIIGLLFLIFNETWGRVYTHRYLRAVLMFLLQGMAVLALLGIAHSIYQLYGLLSLENLWVVLKWRVLFLVIVPLFLAEAFPQIYYEGVKRFSMWRLFRQFNKGKGGSAAFASIGNYKDKTISYIPSSGGRSANILLGSTTFEYDPYARFIKEDSDSNLLTIAGIGSGKSTTVIYPVLSTYSGSVLCIDPKAEHFRATHKRRSQQAGKFKGVTYQLDPFGVNASAGYQSHSYNPLSEIDINSPHALGLINTIAEACVMEESDEKNIYFTETGRNLIAGVIAYILASFPKRYHTLPMVLDVINGIDPKLGIADPERFKQLLREMKCCDAGGGVAQRAATTLSNCGDRERGAILSTIARSMNWIGDVLMREQLTAGQSDFKFADVGADGRCTTVYIVIPLGKMESQKRWLRVLTSLSIALIRERDAKPAISTLFLIDEAPQLGYMAVIKNSYATMRSFGIRLWCFAQNWSQLKALYGDNAYTFIANSTTQFFGVGDIQTAKLISESLGTNMVDGSSRPLMAAAELLTSVSKETNRQIILPAKETEKRDNLPYFLERLTYVHYRNDFRHYAGHESYYPADNLSSDKLALVKAKIAFFFSIARLKILEFFKRKSGAL